MPGIVVEEPSGRRPIADFSRSDGKDGAKMVSRPGSDGDGIEAVRVWLLGGFEVSVGPRIVERNEWRRRKAASLLKLLALAGGHRLHREWVMAALWADLDAGSAANNLHRALHFARKALGSGPAEAGASRYLPLWGGILELCPNGLLWVDVEAFEEAAATARRVREPSAYRAAIELYAGDLLPEDLYEPWTEERREALRRSYHALLVELATMHEQREEYEPAIEALEREVANEPAKEEEHARLMRLYALLGQPREALLWYERLREALSGELGTEPSVASRRLYEEIRAGKFPAATLQFGRPSEGLLDPSRHNLPASRTTFVGREREVLDVKRSLSMTRLLTLSGAGGSGKTRLALEVARDLVSTYPDGAWLVEFAPLSEPGLAPQAVAGALGVREQPGRPLVDTLTGHLRTKDLLLVLDNCEHLVDAVARLADTLLKRCPNLRILATSRETLGIPGEALWPVHPLSLPGEDGKPAPESLLRAGAVRLFVDRARSRLPAFGLNSENAGAVVSVCRKLDGIPLAIELACARMGALAVEHVDKRLDDSLGLLTGGGRTAEPRHQTLRATLDWSHDLLDEDEKRLFERLSVFAGGWELSAAQAVCSDGGEGEILDLLSRLVDKSLVVFEASPEAGGGMRYRMLEPVRQYAREKLQDTGAMPARGEAAVHPGEAERHARYYLALAEEAEPELVGAGQEAWFGRLETEHDNLRTALRWCLERGEPELGLRLAGALGREFWRVRGRLREGLGWLDAALERGPDASPARARALAVAGWMAWQWLDFERSRSLSEEALALCHELGGEQATAAIALHNLGMVEIYGQMRAKEALMFFEQSLALWRQLGDKVGAGRVLQRMGLIAVVRRDFDRAQELYEECSSLSHEAGDRVGITIALWLGGLAALGRNEHDSVRKLCEEGLALARRTGNTHAVAYITHVLAASSGARGQTTRAARLWGAAEALLDTLGLALGPAERHFYAPFIAASRERLGVTAFDAAWDEGKAMIPEEALVLPEQNPPAAPASKPPAVLTRRQSEVADLIGQGLTNRQIADALAISEHTVANHVAATLKKLGLPSRSLIAAWVTESRLRDPEE